MILEGKVILVTGSGRGIGREIARMAAREGAAVVVNDLGGAQSGEGADKTPAQETADEIKAAGGKAVANYGSVASFEDAKQMVRDAVDNFGRLDAVVNNAGVLRDKIFHKMTEDDWDTVIAVHLKGTFNTSRAAVEVFREQGSGSVINFTSTSGLIGNLGQTNYAAAKLGIVGFTRCAAIDTQKFGVRFNAIAPFAWTRMTASIPGADDPENKRIQNLKKMDPAQIAPLVCFLASDRAKEVSGQVFSVRGNEIILFSLPRPTRQIHKAGGWTPEEIAGILPGAFKTNFVPLEVTADVFPYEPLF